MKTTFPFLRIVAVTVFATLLLVSIDVVTERSVCSAERTVATSDFVRQLNSLLKDEVPPRDGKSDATQRCDDTTFVRRVYLDLVGESPSAEEITRYALDPSTDKRIQLVEKLLRDPRFGENWGRYWRDVILYRRTEARALDLVGSTLAEYVAEAINDGTTWDKVATSFITAKGSVRDHGDTSLIVAQSGLPEDITSEVSRIFLGIQIQCAQCHDHPTDRWKRDQFHKLAAFFPRVAIRPDRTSNNFDFVVSVTDTEMRFRPRNNDNRFFGTLEHHMPDLQNPSAKGTLMQPVFFLNEKSLKLGTNDEERRSQLATWLTDPENKWFAKAFVNRIWSELVGEGFYEPVDDMGPDRNCSAPKTLDYLGHGFAESGYDVKWVYRTIIATDAYQQDSRSRRTPEETPFQANCLQRLRSDQLLNSILNVLDIPRGMVDMGGGRGPAGPGPRRFSPRLRFASEFGFDPSERRDEIASTIPQSLALMNSPMFHGALSNSRSGLGKLLNEIKDDETLVVELYLKAFSREPSQKEIDTCLSYVKDVGNRTEAFQDILWALMNSTEFLYRK